MRLHILLAFKMSMRFNIRVVYCLLGLSSAIFCKGSGLFETLFLRLIEALCAYTRTQTHRHTDTDTDTDTHTHTHTHTHTLTYTHTFFLSLSHAQV